MIEEKNLVPRTYHINDPDGIFDLWTQMVDFTSAGERSYAELYQEIFDPDTAPPIFVELMLKSLGNPFTSIYLTLTQKRKLVKLLIPIYKQKGTERGLVNAIRFLTGILIEVIDPHGVDDDGWQVGKSEIGFNTFAGGSRAYCNMLNWTEDFNDSVWIKINGALVQSQAVTGPNPWGRPADRLLLTAPNAAIYQEVQPFFTENQNFTGSIFLRSNVPTTVRLTIENANNAIDSSFEDVVTTTDWVRYSVYDKSGPASTGKTRFHISSPAGFAGQLYAWGAQLVRNDEIQPYAPSDDNGADCDFPGKWAYHFIISSPVALTDLQILLIREIADYMKPAHTHYTLLHPGIIGAPDIYDHWEVAISEIGFNTYVHP